MTPVNDPKHSVSNKLPHSCLIEDYAIIGDTQTAALVSKEGSIDWLCLPRFDSGACFASLLGGETNGFWRITPTNGCERTTRRYQGETLILETDFHTSTGTVRITDCMGIRSEHATIIRMVDGITGHVSMRMDLVVRFDYGWVVPWMTQQGDHLHGIAGPDLICLVAPVETEGENFATFANFTVGPNERVPFVFSWHPQFGGGSCGINADQAIKDTTDWWSKWSGQCTYEGRHRDIVIRSLITLKALTYAPSGGIVSTW